MSKLLDMGFSQTLGSIAKNKKTIVMWQHYGEILGNIIVFIVFLSFTLMAYGIVKTDKKPSFLESPTKSVKTLLVIGTLAFGVLSVLSMVS